MSLSSWSPATLSSPCLTSEYRQKHQHACGPKPVSPGDNTSWHLQSPYCVPGPSLRALPALISPSELPYNLPYRLEMRKLREINLSNIIQLTHKLAFTVATNGLKVSEALLFYPRVCRLAEQDWGWVQACFTCPPFGPVLKIQSLLLLPCWMAEGLCRNAQCL